MPILSHPAFGPRTSLAYITIGTLLDVWTAVWYFTFTRQKEVVSSMEWFLLIGLFLTGLMLVIIGALLGPIGQAARRAELPPSEAIRAETQIQQAAGAPAVVAATPAAPAVAPAPAVGAVPVAAPGQQLYTGR